MLFSTQTFDPEASISVMLFYSLKLPGIRDCGHLKVTLNSTCWNTFRFAEAASLSVLVYCQ